MKGKFYFELNPFICVLFCSLLIRPFIRVAPFDLNEITNVMADQMVNQRSLMVNGKKEMENYWENKILYQIWQRLWSTEALFWILMGNPWIILRKRYCWCKSDEKNLDGFFQPIWQSRRIKHGDFGTRAIDALF